MAKALHVLVILLILDISNSGISKGVPCRLGGKGHVYYISMWKLKRHTVDDGRKLCTIVVAKKKIAE